MKGVTDKSLNPTPNFRGRADNGSGRVFGAHYHPWTAVAALSTDTTILERYSVLERLKESNFLLGHGRKSVNGRGLILLLLHHGQYHLLDPYIHCHISLLRMAG